MNASQNSNNTLETLQASSKTQKHLKNSFPDQNILNSKMYQTHGSYELQAPKTHGYSTSKNQNDFVYSSNYEPPTPNNYEPPTPNNYEQPFYKSMGNIGNNFDKYNNRSNHPKNISMAFVPKKAYNSEAVYDASYDSPNFKKAANKHNNHNFRSHQGSYRNKSMHAPKGYNHNNDYAISNFEENDRNFRKFNKNRRNNSHYKLNNSQYKLNNTNQYYSGRNNNMPQHQTQFIENMNTPKYFSNNYMEGPPNSDQNRVSTAHYQNGPQKSDQNRVFDAHYQNGPPNGDQNRVFFCSISKWGTNV